MQNTDQKLWGKYYILKNGKFPRCSEFRDSAIRDVTVGNRETNFAGNYQVLDIQEPSDTDHELYPAAIVDQSCCHHLGTITLPTVNITVADLLMKIFPTRREVMQVELRLFAWVCWRWCTGYLQTRHEHSHNEHVMIMLSTANRSIAILLKYSRSKNSQ